ncbi:hypothetical protein JXB37_03150 [candidate division WOR-3 bacterium]|nr:hypothetical protein [candidate division WOR-3 bacterium]
MTNNQVPMTNRRRVMAVVLVLGLVALAAAQVRPIREVRQNDSQGKPLLEGQSVTVTGVVSEATHFGGWGPAFVQDATGGVALYGSQCQDLLIGDSITVTGTVKLYYGLTEIDPIASLTNHGAAGAPAPLERDLGWIDDVDTAAGYVENEGWLAMFPRTWIDHAPGERFAGDQNYTIRDGAGRTAALRIDKDAGQLVGMTIPDDSVDLVAVVSQYKPSAPHFGGYQVMPRMASDLGAGVEYMPIAEAIKDEDANGIPDRLGQSVTVTGTVIMPSGIFNSEYLDVYVQDNSGGVNVFDWTLVPLELGDSVEVTGEVDWYRGKTELSGASVNVLAQGRPVPEPVVLTCDEINQEAHEGELVRLVGVRTLAEELAGNENYQLEDASGNCVMRVHAGTDVPGLRPILAPDTFSVVGIKSQYTDSTLPLAGYQFTPRFRTDFSRSAGDIGLSTIERVQEPGPDGVTPKRLDSLVRVRGRVTGPASAFTVGSNKSLYIEDETQGVNVYGCSYPSGTEALLDSLGIEWEVLGTVTEYNGLTEIAGGTMFVTDTNAVPVVPRVLAHNLPLTEGMESDLITVTGDVVEPPVASGGGYNITIKNGSAGITVRVNENSGVNVTWITRGKRIVVTGVVGQYDYQEPYNTGYQILPRMNADVADASGSYPPSPRLVIDSIVPATFSPAELQLANIWVNAPQGYRLDLGILDLEGRTVKTLLTEAQGGAHALLWDGTDKLMRPLPPGIYLVNLKGVPPGGGVELVTRPVVIAIKKR